MRHPIDPLVDYAFKRLFGEERNKNLLMHFLNAVLDLESPIVELQLVSPALGKGSVDEKLCVVDVLARDAQGRAFQVEVQLAIHAGLPERMLYTWAKLYQGQLEEGLDYRELSPAYSVWLLRVPLFPRSSQAHHHFQARDEAGERLSEHLNIHVLELSKFTFDAPALDAEQRWVYFLREAHSWTSLPETLDTPEMRQAMGTLREISEQEKEYYRYNARLDSMRVQYTMERARDEAEAALAAARAESAKREAELAAKDAALSEKDAALSEKDAALSEKDAALQAAQAELAALRAQLAAKGG